MRCYNPKARGYNANGERGIKVHEPWRRDFWSFVRDMGDRPPNCTLERIDPNQDFTPDNCTWKASNRALRG